MRLLVSSECCPTSRGRSIVVCEFHCSFLGSIVVCEIQLRAFVRRVQASELVCLHTFKEHQIVAHFARTGSSQSLTALPLLSHTVNYATH